MNSKSDFITSTGSGALALSTTSDGSSSTHNTQSYIGSSASVLISKTFCTVCGTFGDRLVLRKSGLKCPQCVGRPSKRHWSKLQKQQAQQLLSQMTGSTFRIPNPAGEEFSMQNTDKDSHTHCNGCSRGMRSVGSAPIIEEPPALLHITEKSKTTLPLNTKELPIKEYISETVCYQNALQQHGSASTPRPGSLTQSGDVSQQVSSGPPPAKIARSSSTIEASSTVLPASSLTKKTISDFDETTRSVPFHFCRQQTAAPTHWTSVSEANTARQQSKYSDFNTPRAFVSTSEGPPQDHPGHPAPPNGADASAMAVLESARGQGERNVRRTWAASGKTLPPPPPRPSRRILQRFPRAAEVPTDRGGPSPRRLLVPPLKSIAAIADRGWRASAESGSGHVRCSSQTSFQADPRQAVSARYHRSPSAGVNSSISTTDPYNLLPGAPRDEDPTGSPQMKRGRRQSYGGLSASRANNSRDHSCSSQAPHRGRNRAGSSHIGSCVNTLEPGSTPRRATKSRCVSDHGKLPQRRDSDAGVGEKMASPQFRPKTMKVSLQIAKSSGSRSLDVKKGFQVMSLSPTPRQMAKPRCNNRSPSVSSPPTHTSSSALSSNVHKTLQNASASANASAARARLPVLCSLELSALSADKWNAEDRCNSDRRSSNSSSSSLSRGEPEVQDVSNGEIGAECVKPNVSLDHIRVLVVTPTARAPSVDRKFVRSTPRPPHRPSQGSPRSRNHSVDTSSPRCPSPKSGRRHTARAAVVQKGKFTVTRYSPSHHAGRGGAQSHASASTETTDFGGAAHSAKSDPPPPPTDPSGGGVEVKKITFELRVTNALTGGLLHRVRRNLYTDLLPAFTQVRLVAEGAGLARVVPVPSPSIPSLRIATDGFIEQRRVECQRCLDAVTAAPDLLRHPAVLRLLALAMYADAAMDRGRGGEAGGRGGPPPAATAGCPSESAAPAPSNPPSAPPSPSAPLTSQALELLRSASHDLASFSRTQSQNTGLLSNQSSVLRRRRLDRFTHEDLEAVQLGSVVGRGTYGTVYQGFLQTNDGPLIVAVKELSLSPETSPEVLQSIQNELNILCNTQHKNIIRFLGSVYLPETYRLRVFTEYLECGTISSMVKRFGAMPLLAIQKYMTQILTGLSHLHSLNIVHRDLKGDNILLNKRGKVRLADFGCSDALAHQVEMGKQGPSVDGEECSSSRPHSGDSAACEGERENARQPAKPASAMVAFPVGTPLWMAPEVIHGELSEAGKKVSPAAADIWALGCIGIEMLDRPIWSFGDINTHPFAIMYHIARTTTPPDGLFSEEELQNSFQGPGTENDAEKIETFALYRDFLLHCLELKPENRWTAQELLKHPFFYRTLSKQLRWVPPQPPMPTED